MDVVERARVVVEPRRHRRHAQCDAVGVAAPVALAQVELGLGQCRRELLARDAVLGEAEALALEQRAELAGAARVHTLQREHGLRLQDAVDEGRLEVVGEAGVHDSAFKRRLVRPGQGVKKDVDREHTRTVGGGADHVAHADLGVALGRGHPDDAALGRDGRLQRKRIRGAGVSAAGLGKALIDEGELALDVEVAVEHGIAVGEVVVARVGLEELLVGEAGDGAGVAARLEAVGGVGEQRARKRLIENVVRVGERTLHLVEHDAVVRKARVRSLTLDLEVPALLLKDAGAVVNRRVQDGVEVDAHEVLEVGRVRRCHGVHRLVGESERVQEGLHARLEQVDEGLLDGVSVRAAQHRVLEDVEHAGIVGGRGLERYGERLVRVVIGEPHQASARGLVAHDVGLAADLADRLDVLDDKPGMARSHGERRFGGQEVFLCHNAPFCSYFLYVCRIPQT